MTIYDISHAQICSTAIRAAGAVLVFYRASSYSQPARGGPWLPWFSGATGPTLARYFDGGAG